MTGGTIVGLLLIAWGVWGVILGREMLRGERDRQDG